MKGNHIHIKKVLVFTILYFIWGFYTVINMYATSNFQINILPEFWNVFWYVLQADSLGCRLRWSVGMCVRGALGVNTVESGGMKWDRTEEHWPDDLSWPGLEWWGLSGGCPDTSTGQAVIPPPGWVVHIGCSRRGWWFKLAHWQHFQQLDSESLREGQDSTSPCSPRSMYHSSRGRWWGCTVGETLDDLCVSENGDLVILLNTLWSKK